jgi:hydroxypyruvate isomerase
MYRQAFAWWSFEEAPHHHPDLLTAVTKIGFEGVDFLPPRLWPQARQFGLELVIIDGHKHLEIGFNDPGQHRDLADQVRRNLELAVANGVRNLSVASGDRRGQDPAAGIAACVDGLAPLADEALAAGVGLLLEPLNTKIDHAGHDCDSTAWGLAVIDQVASPALRLLYDAYHMQIMEGDLIRTVGTYLDRIGHIHTAGVPGRHELDDTQEVNWKAIAGLLRDRSYAGYVTHELIPRGDPVAALRQAYDIFAVPAT